MYFFLSVSIFFPLSLSDNTLSLYLIHTSTLYLFNESSFNIIKPNNKTEDKRNGPETQNLHIDRLVTLRPSSKPNETPNMIWNSISVVAMFVLILSCKYRTIMCKGHSSYWITLYSSRQCWHIQETVKRFIRFLFIAALFCSTWKRSYTCRENVREEKLGGLQS